MKILSLFFSEQCSNFSKGIVFGKLCKPLCVAKEFLVTGCIHHSQTVVINAVWKGKKVVLKRKRAQSMKSSIEYLDCKYFTMFPFLIVRGGSLILHQ